MTKHGQDHVGIIGVPPDPLGPLPKAKTVGGCEQCGKLRGRKSYVYRIDGMWRCYECARRRLQSS